MDSQPVGSSLQRRQVKINFVILFSDIEAYFNLIRETKEVKNTNNTFLIKLIVKLIGKIKRDQNLFARLEELCKEFIKFCDESNNISMKNRIQMRLAELYFIHGYHNQALEVVQKALVDLKRYEDNLGLIVLQLTESKIHYATKGMAKAKAALTSVKTLCTKVYIEPKLQAEIDMHGGVLSLHEKDFNLAYSYFYESFDVYNIPHVKKPKKALKALQYMILSKIMAGSIDDVNAIILGKQARNFYGTEVEALKSIMEAVRDKSVGALKTNIEKYHTVLLQDETIVHHLINLQNELLEKNLIKIIEPYSVVEIDFVTNSIGLPYLEILSKLSQMILDKKINGILDQGRGSLILYEETQSNVIYILLYLIYLIYIE
jgi:26S proteasome regulatory subunit N6